MLRANRSQSKRPRAIPPGTPMAMPPRVATEAFQATVTAS
jgi:hypothetical protein